MSILDYALIISGRKGGNKKTVIKTCKKWISKTCPACMEGSQRKHLQWSSRTIYSINRRIQHVSKDKISFYKIKMGLKNNIVFIKYEGYKGIKIRIRWWLYAIKMSMWGDIGK